MAKRTTPASPAAKAVAAGAAAAAAAPAAKVSAAAAAWIKLLQETDCAATVAVCPFFSSLLSPFPLSLCLPEALSYYSCYSSERFSRTRTPKFSLHVFEPNPEGSRTTAYYYYDFQTTVHFLHPHLSLGLSVSGLFARLEMCLGAYKIMKTRFRPPLFSIDNKSPQCTGVSFRVELGIQCQFRTCSSLGSLFPALALLTPALICLCCFRLPHSSYSLALGRM